MTNKATLWYVPLSLKNVNKVLEVPPIQVGQLTWVPQNWNLSSLWNGTNLALLALPAVPVALPIPFLPAFYSSMQERSRRMRGRSVMRSKSWIGWKLSRGMVTSSYPSSTQVRQAECNQCKLPNSTGRPN